MPACGSLEGEQVCSCFTTTGGIARPRTPATSASAHQANPRKRAGLPRLRGLLLVLVRSALLSVLVTMRALFLALETKIRLPLFAVGALIRVPLCPWVHQVGTTSAGPVRTAVCQFTPLCPWRLASALSDHEGITNTVESGCSCRDIS